MAVCVCSTYLGFNCKNLVIATTTAHIQHQHTSSCTLIPRTHNTTHTNSKEGEERGLCWKGSKTVLYHHVPTHPLNTRKPNKHTGTDPHVHPQPHSALSKREEKKDGVKERASTRASNHKHGGVTKGPQTTTPKKRGTDALWRLRRRCWTGQQQGKAGWGQALRARAMKRLFRDVSRRGHHSTGAQSLHIVEVSANKRPRQTHDARGAAK